MAVAFDGAVLIADGRRSDRVAAFDPRHHLLNGLAAKLLPFQFAAGDGDGLVVATLGRILKSEVGAVDGSAEISESVTQLPIEAGASRKALQVIKDDHIVLAAIGLEMLEHANHAGAFHVVAIAGLAVGVDGLNRDAELRRVVSAEMLLAAVAVSVEFLLLARHAAIDDGGVYGFHFSSSQDIWPAQSAALTLRHLRLNAIRR